MLSRSTLLVIVVLALDFCAVAQAEEFIEDFTTTQFKDLINTTVWWDTAAGELKLHPLEITLAGSYDTPGSAGRVFISGDFAYVADLLPGLQVIDISDPAYPDLAGDINTPGDAKDVFVSGDYAYVADSGAGLQVIDVSDPANPTIAGGLDTPGSARSVFVAGDHVYVGDSGSGLQVIDISDPTNPSLAGSYDTPGSASGVFVSGDYAYVADEGSGLQVIDISDPTNPSLTGSHDTPNIAWGVFVSGNYAYVADGGTGLQVISIHDPSNPTAAGSYDTPGSARDVFVSGDHAYVSDWDSGLQVIDIGDPTIPIHAGSYDTPGFASAAYVWGEHVYVGDGSAGLQVIDIREPGIPNLIGAWGIAELPSGICVSGDHALVADANQGLLVIDISEATAPVLVGYYNPGGGLTGGLVVSGDHLYAANWTGLLIIDISDPGNPTPVGSFDTPSNALGVAVSGDHAYVACGSSGLFAIDVSNPPNPVLAGSYDTPDYAWSVFISGDHAYVADGGSGLQIIDISDPMNPTFAGSYDTLDSATKTFISGDHAYVADWYGGLQVIDISDPTNPTWAGSIDTPDTAMDVIVSGDYAFLADLSSGLQVIDISDPTNPASAGGYQTSTAARCIFDSGDLACVGVTNAGLYVFRIFSEGPFRLLEDEGRSLPVNLFDYKIPRVRLSTIQSGTIFWKLSADAGGSWVDVLPDWSWTRTLLAGNQLIWRSTHFYADDTVNPTCTELNLEMLYETALIEELLDVPDDQGGWLRLHFTRSGYDFSDETIHPVTGYQIYRRVDDEPLKDRITTEAVVRDFMPLGRPEITSFNQSQLVALEDRLFLQPGKVMGGERDEFPAGIWEVVSWVAATQQDNYVALIPTVGDSTGSGITWSAYLMTTHTMNPSIWYVSPPDSGYSVDNIAPSIPTGLIFENQVLTWDESPDEDFNYFTVYGGESEIFDEAELLDHTVETTYNVPGATYNWYFVTTSDLADNESEPASVQSGIVAVEPDTEIDPSAYALRSGAPNPFSTGTVISFNLPERTATRLMIYDVSGRLVTSLVNDQLPAGYHHIGWTGRTASGGIAPAGVYFVRLETANYTVTRKLLRLK